MSQKQDKQRIYNSKEWKITRTAKLQRDPLCEVCKANGKIVAAQAVHHVIPIETASDFAYMQELAFRFSNLLSVCYQCHSDIHQQLNSRTREGHQRAAATAVERWAQLRAPRGSENEDESVNKDLPNVKSNEY